jgi:hypothetical protein
MAAVIKGGNEDALTPNVFTMVIGGIYLVWQAALRKHWASQTMPVVVAAQRCIK